MAGHPTAEKPPQGLNAYWLGVWRHALKVLKAQGTWAWEQKPLLDEYLFAVREACVAREQAEEDPYHETEKGLLHPHPGFAQADRAARRAVVLADTLRLTPKTQPAGKGTGAEGDDGSGGSADSFEALDELTARREARG